MPRHRMAATTSRGVRVRRIGGLARRMRCVSRSVTATKRSTVRTSRSGRTRESTTRRLRAEQEEGVAGAVAVTAAVGRRLRVELDQRRRGQEQQRDHSRGHPHEPAVDPGRQATGGEGEHQVDQPHLEDPSRDPAAAVGDVVAGFSQGRERRQDRHEHQQHPEPLPEPTPPCVQPDGERDPDHQRAARGGERRGLGRMVRRGEHGGARGEGDSAEREGYELRAGKVPCAVPGWVDPSAGPHHVSRSRDSTPRRWAVFGC